LYIFKIINWINVAATQEKIVNICDNISSVSIESQSLFIQSPNFPSKYSFSSSFFWSSVTEQCSVTIKDLPANKWIGIWTADDGTKLQQWYNTVYNTLKIGNITVSGNLGVNTLLYTSCNSKKDASIKIIWNAIEGTSSSTFKVKVAGKPHVHWKFVEMDKYQVFSPKFINFNKTFLKD